MKEFIREIRSSLDSKNWYSALTLTVTLPDIAGKVDYPTLHSQRRYTSWFDKYVELQTYHKDGDIIKLDKLLGSDCYALRCSLLHEGNSNTSHQSAKREVDFFHFYTPSSRFTIDLTASGTIIFYQVREFCEAILTGIEKWLVTINNDPVKIKAINKFSFIYPSAIRS